MCFIIHNAISMVRGRPAKLEGWGAAALLCFSKVRGRIVKKNVVKMSASIPYIEGIAKGY